ncbi:pancreatic triacylglycerol lipase-like [Anticarsia gemmatalis]|uniref:pancreatic triacylglycerol lipase-like n=1 Tax=Anticarsia gemmatalis TaxID=129554 RepID=UPI003F76F57A
MYRLTALFGLCLFALGNALPSPVLSKLDSDLRYQYAIDGAGEPHLVDLWMTVDDVLEAARYDPSRQNTYHLFTRENPTVSQPLLINSPGLLQLTNYRNDRRTIVLIHDWLESVTADFNTVLIPALLAAEDLNIIVVDWSVGASSISYRTVIANTIASGKSVAEFINWVNTVTASSSVMYHVIGFGFGGHQAGIVSRNIVGNVAYVTGLDPAFIGWSAHPDRFAPTDGQYTEVIHTNYGINGYLADLAQVDFYPNGGISMPGCNSHACDHARSFFYFAESIGTGGFTGRQCINYFAAITSTCNLLPGRLQMGGLRPKNGQSGVYLLETNAAPPFSRG